MSQSSIEWLAHELSSLSFDYLVGQITNEEHNERYDKIIQQAKEMHKEEIEDAYDKGSYDEYEYHINDEPRKNSEIYYNETFNNETN